ncbi:MAG: hypothetical protein AAGD34_21105, partial [Pseudomonadota bacterium]
MSFYITATTLDLACRGAGLTLNFDDAKEFAGHFDHGVEGGVPDGTGDGAIHLFADPQRLAAFARSGAAPVGLMLL